MGKYDSQTLRVFCICGQKMKIGPDMYGQPGKCIACRQKIRIPDPAELPDGLTEIHLKDHPEYLRKNKSHKAKSDDTADDVQLEKASSSMQKRWAVDVFEPLRLITSFEYKIHREFRKLELRDDEDIAVAKDTLRGYEELVHKHRNYLDEKLRQKLLDTAGEQAATNEEIIRVKRDFRQGKITYQDFLEEMIPLRGERENLERFRLNLRGWLSTKDPHTAGGYIHVKLDDLSLEPPEITFPDITQHPQPLLDTFAEQLKEALINREEIEKKLAAVQQIPAEEQAQDPEAFRLARNLRIRHKHNRASIGYYRDRIAIIVQDCESDLRSLRDHIMYCRNASLQGQIDRNTLKQIEHEISQAETDVTRMRKLADNVLHANTPDDIPQISGTFLSRVAKTKPERTLDLESFMAWGACIALVMALMLPFGSNQPNSNFVLWPSLTMGLVVTLLFWAFSPVTPSRPFRSVLFNLFWCAGAVFILGLLFKARLTSSQAGALLRQTTTPFLMPGFMAFTVAAALMGAACWTAVFKLKKSLLIPLASSVLVTLAFSLFLADIGFFLHPVPRILSPEFSPSTDIENTYDVVLKITNDGNRPFWLVNIKGEAPLPVHYVLERRIGQQSWEVQNIPLRVSMTDGSITQFESNESQAPVEVFPDTAVAFTFNLSPGTYRLLLNSDIAGSKRLSKTFSLAPLKIENTPVPPPPRNTTTGAETSAQTSFSNNPDAVGEVSNSEVSDFGQWIACELQGIMNTGHGKIAFRINVEHPSGERSRMSLGLGEPIYGQWRVLEYNPGRNTLTLTNDQKLVILKSGDQVRLELSPEE